MDHVNATNGQYIADMTKESPENGLSDSFTT